MSELGMPSVPCGSCPYRLDVPSGVWAAEEYAKLSAYDGQTWEQDPSIFMCHQQDGCVCSGWVGCHDMEQSLAVRMGVLDGRLDREAVDALCDYISPVPLFHSGAAAAAHGLAEVENVGPRAARAIDRLTAKRLA